MIRQAISCDVCGAEKKQTNHWFVAAEQAGELRIAGWSSRSRLRTGAKHLCGQTCLHKLVDEFMARAIAGRIAPPAECTAEPEAVAETDASLTSKAAYAGTESSARMLSVAAAAVPPRPSAASMAVVVPMQPRQLADETRPLPPAPRIEEAPAYASRRWRAEAWERERMRDLHAVERKPEVARRRQGV